MLITTNMNLIFAKNHFLAGKTQINLKFIISIFWKYFRVVYENEPFFKYLKKQTIVKVKCIIHLIDHM